MYYQIVIAPGTNAPVVIEIEEPAQAKREYINAVKKNFASGVILSRVEPGGFPRRPKVTTICSHVVEGVLE